MRVRSPGRRPRRPAFTLIELLVVMTIMVILATLVYFLLPGFLNREKASKGADLVQQWLLTAKQRALRDQSPRGVRLNIDNDGLVRTINYIEKPADFTTGYLDPNTADVGLTPPAAPGPYTTFAVRGVNGADWQTNPPIAQNDYLYIPTLDTGPWHRITAVNYGSAPNFTPYITIQGPGYMGTLTAPIQYSISRAPRLLEGEETLQIPQDVVIDMRPNWSLPSGTAGGGMNILFSPGGGVLTDPSLSAGTSPEKIILWVRDVPQNADATAFPDPRGGNPLGAPPVAVGTPPADPKSVPTEQSLIVVYSRTGLIAAHPPAMNAANADLADPTNPYQFAQDGQSSGL
ncbi:MAG TPA: type II secretion system protein [Gemmataceae bacterium]|nr:type II secretion system protein [Gemmataceae bacterium]